MAVVNHWAVKLTADVSKFKKDLNSARKTMADLQKDSQKLSSQINKSLKISGSVGSATRSLKRLDNSFKNITKESRRMKRSVKKDLTSLSRSFRGTGKTMSRSFRQPFVRMRKEASNSTNALSGITKGLKSVAGALGLALSIRGLTKLSKDSIKYASDLEEVQNVVDAVFPTMSKKVEDFASTSMEKYRLTTLEAKRFSGTLGAMMKSYGFNEKAAYDMGTSLTALAGDMASFYNISNEAAFKKIRSGISGMSAPLKQLGINMNIANVESWMMSKGIDRSFRSLTEQEKVMMRYNYLLDVTKDAQGDFARNSNSWANQVAILSGRFKELTGIIGRGFIAVLSPVIRVINELLSKVITLANAFAAFMAKITGKDQKSVQSGGAAAKALGEAMGESTDAMDDASMGASNAAEEGAKRAEGTADKAKKKAKDAKKELESMGFDQLNKLSSPREESDGGGSTGGGGAGRKFGGPAGGLGISEGLIKADKSITDTGSLLDPLIKKMKELKSLFEEGFKLGVGDADFASIQEHITNIGKSLKDIVTDPLVVGAGERLLDSYALNIGKVAGSMVSVGVTIAENLTGGIDQWLSQDSDRIKTRIVQMLDIQSERANIVGDFAVTAADIFSVFSGENAKNLTTDLISVFAESFAGVKVISGQFANDIGTLITEPFNANKGQIKTVLDDMLGDITIFTGSVRTTVKDLTDKAISIYDEKFGPLFDSLTKGLSDLMKTVLDTWQKYGEPVFKAAMETGAELIEGTIKPILEKVMEVCGKIAELLKTLWERAILPLARLIVTKFGPVIFEIIHLAIDVFGSFAKAVGKVIETALDTLGSFISFITNVFKGNWQGAWEDIKNILHNIFLKPFEIAWNLIKDIMTKVWENHIRPIVDKIKDALGNVLGGAVKSLKDVWNRAWDGIASVVEGVWSRIKGAINVIIRGINWMVQGVVDGINGMISALNRVSFSIPSWVPGIGGSRFGLSISHIYAPSIPQLADGGIVGDGQLFIANEAGPELIGNYGSKTGVMNNNQIVEAVSRGVADAVANVMMTMANRDSYDKRDIVIKVDSEEVARATARGQRRLDMAY